MTGRLIVALAVASLIPVSSSLQTLAQAPAGGAGARGQSGAVIGSQVTSPCVGAQMSPQCAVYRLDGVNQRLDGIDSRLNAIDQAVRDLSAASRNQGSSGRTNLGPQIAPPAKVTDDEKADGGIQYLERKIDSIGTTVEELRNRVNLATSAPK